MKVIVIGDIHGRNNWESMVSNIDLVDHVVFLGDYCDSYFISPSKVILNFSKIIQFKKDNLDKVTLLLGNHDLQYYFVDDPDIKCSGYKEKFAMKYNKLLRQNLSLFTLSHTITINDTTYLFSHAGINSVWLESVLPILSPIKNKVKSIQSSIFDILLLGDFKYSLWDISYWRNGRYDFGSMVWTDIREYSDEAFSLEKFKTFLDIPLDNKIVQIVGHSRVPSPTNINNQIYYFDSQDSEPTFGMISEEGVKVLHTKLLQLQEANIESADSK